MINNSEYEKISALIKKGDLKKLQDFINLSYEKGNKKYLLEAKNALADYLDRFPQSFIKYLDDTGSRENPLVESLFGQQKKESNRIFISDNVSGGFILYDDEIIDGSSEQRKHMYHERGLLLSPIVSDEQNYNLKIAISYFSKIEENKKKLKLVSEIEMGRKQVGVYGKGYANPHYFERTRYNAIKLLGEDAKIYISSPKSSPLLYGESSKGKGIILGLRK